MYNKKQFFKADRKKAVEIAMSFYKVSFEEANSLSDKDLKEVLAEKSGKFFEIIPTF